MNQTYQYTLLSQDGSTSDLGVRTTEMELSEMRKILNCQTIELVPSIYFDREEVLLWGDEEARFSSENIRNPHTKVLEGSPSFGEPAEFDCVGDLILQEEI